MAGERSRGKRRRREEEEVGEVAFCRDVRRGLPGRLLEKMGWTEGDVST